MTPTNTHRHKRGDTFDMSGPIVIHDGDVPLPDLTGWAGKSQIRTLTGSLVAELQFIWIDAAQCLARLRCATPTTSWPIGPAVMDIEFTGPAGDVVSTPTARFEIVKDETQ